MTHIQQCHEYFILKRVKVMIIKLKNKNQMRKSDRYQAKWSIALLSIVLTLGILFRFTNLDLKPYWHDETYTSLRVSGYSTEEVVRQLYNGQIINVADLQKYQNLSPEKNAIDTIKLLAKEVPEHPPLYYVMARFWAEWFGTSPAAMRSLPALISLLGFVGIYWLCLELFASPLVGSIAVALFAVSPIYVRYAQEARQYSLWMVAILLSCIALLRAMRIQTKQSWLFYTIAVITSLYCHLFSVFVFLGHAIYVGSIERFRFSRRLINYLISSLISIFFFLPWIFVIVSNHQSLVETTNWMKQSLQLSSLIWIWSLQLCRIFISWNTEYNGILIYLAIPILFLVIFSLYFLCHKTSRKIWLFIFILIGSTASFLIIPDLIFGGVKSTNERYFLPAYLGVHLSVAYFLAAQITARFAKQTKRKIWQLLAVLIISSGVVSCAMNSQMNTWWGWSEFDVRVANIVNQSQHPLLISDMPLGVVMPLSHRLEPNAKMLLLSEQKALKIPDSFSNVFVYNPTESLQAEIAKQGISQKLIYQFKDNSLVISVYKLE